MKKDSNVYKFIAGLTLATASILLIPLIAMQYTDEVYWTLGDFIIMGTLILGTGLTFKLITRKYGNLAYRVAIALSLATGFLLIWVNGAVGIIGNEANPANLMYFGVLAVGIIGAIISRLQPPGMSRTLLATAVAQASVPVFALIFWPPRVISWGAAGVSGVFTLNAFFILLLIVSSLLFRHAAQKTSEQNKA